MNKSMFIVFVSFLVLVLLPSVSAAPPDNNGDGCVSLGEISSYVAQWLQGQISLSQVSSGVSWWLNGCTQINFVKGTEYLGDDRAIDWNPGIPGGIPNYVVGANIMNYGAVGDGVHDDTQALIDAIAATPQGTALLLPAGKYNITSGVRWEKGIAIRGEGPDNTKILCYFGGGSCLSPFKYGAASAFTSVTGGYNKGSTQVTVANPDLFIVGRYFQIQQSINDPEIFGCGGLGCDGHNVTGQISRIIAKNGNVLSLEEPLHYSYNPLMNPIARNLNLIEGAGIEDLAIVRPLELNSSGANIHFGYAANCWVKNVWSQYGYRSHISMWYSYKCEIRDNVFNNNWVRGSGGQGYGTEILMKSSNNLIINNIYWRLRHGAIFAYGPSGNVVAYNYFKDNLGGSANNNINTGWLPPDSVVHGNYPNMNLFEGNVMNSFATDNVWGSNGHTTIFRNRILRESYFVTYPQINMFPYIWIETNNKYVNVVGNELGTYGQQMNGNGWTELSTTASGSLLIFVNPSDPQVNATTLFHGNYEYLSNPSGAQLLLGWNPEFSQDLPASLFLNQKPSFFGNLDWPAFGPDRINSGDKIPAQVKYETLAAQNKIGPNFTYNINE